MFKALPFCMCHIHILILQACNMLQYLSCCLKKMDYGSLCWLWKNESIITFPLWKDYLKNAHMYALLKWCVINISWIWNKESKLTNVNFYCHLHVHVYYTSCFLLFYFIWSSSLKKNLFEFQIWQSEIKNNHDGHGYFQIPKDIYNV